MTNRNNNNISQRLPRSAGLAQHSMGNLESPTPSRSQPSPRTRSNTQQQQRAQPSTSASDGTMFPCPNCERSFPTKIGLGVHRRRAHIEEANAEVNIERLKKRWSDEEKRILAREEALATISGVKFINQHLDKFCKGERTLEAIKGVRRAQAYKDLVAAAILDLRAASPRGQEVARHLSSSSSSSPSSSASNASFHSASGEIPSTPPQDLNNNASPNSPRWSDMYDSIPSAIDRLIILAEEVNGWNTEILSQIAKRMLDGDDIMSECMEWLKSVFPTPLPRRPRQNVQRRRKGGPKKRRRRREYARIQELFKHHQSRAAKEILDGGDESTLPSISVMTEYWRDVLTQESCPVSDTNIHTPPSNDLEFVWHAITCEETTAVKVDLKSAPGLDQISSRQWRAVPACIKALFFNIVLASGGFPQEFLVSRTVFIPKKKTSSTPSEFRPISIASVVVRHLHKILAERIREADLIDVRQRCMEDGCLENITILASLLHDSRQNLKEIHVTSLDFAQAYDSVSHKAINQAMIENGLPKGFIKYVARVYENSKTVIQVGNTCSEPIRVKRGVRQGDPLSSLVFCLNVNRVLRKLPGNIGYEYNNISINAAAYADDIFLVSSTKSGMEILLEIAEEEGAKQGLKLNAGKCSALSIIPDGRKKKYKVLTTPQYHLKDKTPLLQLTPSQEWRYLGVDFRPIGPKKVGGSLNLALERITRAPLKPQQRLKILRCYLITRLYHRLVLTGTTLRQLRNLDKEIRVAIRKWLNLPKDIPVAYFHTQCKDGGIGIPSFTTTIPGLMRSRLLSLANSNLPMAREVFNSSWVTQRLRWAEMALTRDGNRLFSAERIKEWWTGKLYATVDGKELRESWKTSSSTNWIDAGSYGIPGRDYMQYHHVHINTLPTRIRTSRGFRRVQRDVQCRAGCSVTETAAHVIQGCHRTHGGRIKRHDAVTKVVAESLRNQEWQVDVEPRIQTSEGLRKPDMVARKEGKVAVIDTQIVSAQQPLEDAHKKKVEKYKNNMDVRREVRNWKGEYHQEVQFTTVTISWRGVWCKSSESELQGIGITKRTMNGITTRVLQGSHTNWTRWNKMTTMEWNTGRGRAGVG